MSTTPVPVSTLPPGFRIVQLSGPSIVAYLLHWGLFGTLTIQIYLYYEAFPKDKLFNKCLVYGIYIVEFVQTMLVTHDAFAIFGYGFGNAESLTNMDFNWLAVPVMSGLGVSFVGQSFYAHRLHNLSKSRMLPIFILALSLTSTVGGLVTGVFTFQGLQFAPLYYLRLTKFTAALQIWCGGSALCDILITVFMTYYLAKSDTGFRSTRLLLSKLIRLTIETGSITALVALANLILFFVFPGRIYYGVPALLMPKLYANTILAVLNARFQIVGGRATYVSTSDFTDIDPSSVRNGQSSTTGGGTRRTVPRITTTVTINKEVCSDTGRDDRVEMKVMGVSSKLGCWPLFTDPCRYRALARMPTSKTRLRLI
ncbi:hypothetical protein DFH07DRAFT_918751 [Mycena maculata]|uniref:DUF6534 domain-containing protein n=1 Tax=Mycena maculata TaxID=230809 RepID=A0AAD7J9A2_9AGAR|nr:hypothetical protein DFH07DRAFT_918751 [Mycena maculata]